MADPSATSGSADATANTNTTTTTNTQDPFAAQRDTDNDPFTKTASAGDAAGDAANGDAIRNDSDGLSPPPLSPDRRLSKEWDASKVPPSQFQRRKGSIYSTPSSRDSQHNNAERDKAFHEKLKEKGWNILGKK